MYVCFLFLNNEHILRKKGSLAYMYTSVDSIDVTLKISSFICLFQFYESYIIETPLQYQTACIDRHHVSHNKFNFNG